MDLDELTQKCQSVEQVARILPCINIKSVLSHEYLSCWGEACSHTINSPLDILSLLCC